METPRSRFVFGPLGFVVELIESRQRLAPRFAVDRFVLVYWLEMTRLRTPSRCSFWAASPCHGVTKTLHGQLRLRLACLCFRITEMTRSSLPSYLWLCCSHRDDSLQALPSARLPLFESHEKGLLRFVFGLPGFVIASRRCLAASSFRPRGFVIKSLNDSLQLRPVCLLVLESRQRTRSQLCLRPLRFVI
jgi:hypothetical protein